MHGEACWATVHRVAKSHTRLSHQAHSHLLLARSSLAVEIPLTPLFPSLLLFTPLGVSSFKADPEDLPWGV